MKMRRRRAQKKKHEREKRARDAQRSPAAAKSTG
jgi:hypothetical protein